MWASYRSPNDFEIPWIRYLSTSSNSMHQKLVSFPCLKIGILLNCNKYPSNYKCPSNLTLGHLFLILLFYSVPFFLTYAPTHLSSTFMLRIFNWRSIIFLPKSQQNLLDLYACKVSNTACLLYCSIIRYYSPCFWCVPLSDPTLVWQYIFFIQSFFALWAINVSLGHSLLLALIHSILSIWNTYFLSLLSVYQNPLPLHYLV